MLRCAVAGVAGDEKPLVSAAKGWHVEVVSLLLELGVDPDTPDLLGYTALEWATTNQDATMLNLLARYNASHTEQ